MLASLLADASAQLDTLITSYALWAYSVPTALSILVILLLRMARHKLPDENMAASGSVSLGPIGTAALGMLVIGADAHLIFAAHGLGSIGNIVEGIGLITGILFWGLGL